MIEVDNLSVQAGSFQLNSISFQAPKGAYAVLMGRTGCGKTTLLEAICGLKKVTGGSIHLDGRDVTWLKPALRGVGFVPQDGALFSTMTVEEHLAFSPIVHRWPRSAIRERVDELADLLGIAHLLPRKPFGLSGGERQRVALGRALAARPTILCLDEPLSALDDETRDSLCGLLKSVQEYSGVTTLHITHNRREAQVLADKLFRMDNGVLREVVVEAPREWDEQLMVK